MSFTNITDEELEGKGVTGLPDTPGLSTIEMQQKFDEYSVFLKDKLKTLISELEAEAGALNIGATVPENITADGNIQSILDGLRQYVDDTVVALGTGDMATGIYDPNRDGVIAPAQGGTGQTTMQGARNAMGLGNTLNALPIENGGTGANTAAGARENLGLGNTTGPLPVVNGGTGVTSKEALKQFLYGDAYKVPVSGGGTGKTSVTAGSVLVGNGADTMTERTIDSTSGGTQGSNALITSGAVNSKVREMQTTFQDGVDTIVDAIERNGVTLSASTPSACADGIDDVATDKYNAGYKAQHIIRIKLVTFLAGRTEEGGFTIDRRNLNVTKIVFIGTETSSTVRVILRSDGGTTETLRNDTGVSNGATYNISNYSASTYPYLAIQHYVRSGSNFDLAVDLYVDF